MVDPTRGTTASATGRACRVQRARRSIAAEYCPDKSSAPNDPGFRPQYTTAVIYIADTASRSTTGSGETAAPGVRISFAAAARTHGLSSTPRAAASVHTYGRALYNSGSFSEQ